jgi:ElaB/YqjD/DUF883 family membrane-anchored ribosome-binding protein
MTDQSRALTDSSRDSLRARIEAAERRNAERTLADSAREAAKAAAEHTRANPLTVIGGALAVGLMIGLLTRPGRRVARRVVTSATGALSGAASSASSGVKSITTRGGSRIGTMFGEALVAYVMTLVNEVVDTARTGQERAAELGDAAGAQTRKLKAGATDAAGSAAASSRDIARKTRDRAERVVQVLRRKTEG